MCQHIYHVQLNKAGESSIFHTFWLYSHAATDVDDKYVRNQK